MPNNVSKVENKKLSECTDQQKKFLAALTSPEILDIPPKSRWRWAAQQAGYSDNITIATIIRPIQHLIADQAELVLARSSMEASWQLANAAGGGDIDAQTKDRISAAKDILDRVIPKKDPSAGKVNIPMAVLVLPAKQKIAEIEYEDISSD